jgi:hypothetical protein
MCITGCAPKAGMRPVLLEISKDFNKLEMFRNDPAYLIKELDLDLGPIASELQPYFEGKWPKGDTSWQTLVKDYAKSQLKNIRFKMDDYLYQGCILYCRGGVRHTERARQLVTEGLHLSIFHGNTNLRDQGGFPLSLRAVQHMKLSSGKRDIPEIIKFIFVFAHNSNIRGYLFQAPDWFHVVSPELTLRFLEHQKPLAFENIIQGITYFYLKNPTDITGWLKNRILELAQEQKTCCIFCHDESIKEEFVNFIKYNFRKDSKMFFALMDTIV